MADRSYKLTLSLSDGSTINAGTITAPQGPNGANGATFTPSVSAAGVLSWTNNGGLTNPPPINIKGPKGDDAIITASDVENWGFTKNKGTVTSVAVKMNGAIKGTVTSSGTIDLGTVLTSHQDISGKANLDGGNTFTGKQTLNSPGSDGYSINAAGYVKGSWLQASAIANKGANTGKVCVFDNSGWIYYRTPAEILTEAGGAKASDIPDVSGSTGTSTTSVMSQKATTDELAKKAKIVGGNTFENTQYFSGYSADVNYDYSIIDCFFGDGDNSATIFGVKHNANANDSGRVLIGADDGTNNSVEIQLNGNAGTSGQVLTSQGAGVTPIWKELVTLDTVQDITGNKTFTTSQSGGPKIGIYNGQLSVRSSSTSGGSIIWDTPSDLIAADFTVDENGAHLGLGVDAAADIVLNGDSGTAGQVLTSQGANNTPIWGNVTKHGYTELTNEDLNTILTPGWYRAARNHSCKNIPIGSRNEFILIVESSSPNYIQQTFYVLGILSTYYIRYTNNGGTSWPGAGWYTYQLVGTDVQTFYGRKTFSNGITLNSSLQVNGSSGTAGQVLTSTGTGTPQWAFPSSSGGSVASVVDLTGSLIGGDAYFPFNNGEEGSFTGMIYCEYNTSAGDFEFQINDQIFSCTPASQDITLRVTIDRFYDGYAYSYYYTIISNDGLINNSGFFRDTNRDMYISTSMGSSYAQGGVGTIIKKVL